MTASAMLLALAMILSADLIGAVGKSAERANIPDLMQMHTGSTTDKNVPEYSVLCTKMITAELLDKTTVNLSVEMGDHTVFPVIYSKGNILISQTAERQPKRAAKVSTVTGAAVIAVVVTLFMRLITEKNSGEISLQKALGFRAT